MLSFYSDYRMILADPSSGEERSSYDDVMNTFRIELEQITKYIEEVWLKATWLAHEYQHKSKRGDLEIPQF
jgi:hypothetical protein